MIEGLADIAVGDKVLIRGEWYPVVRVTKKWFFLGPETFWGYGYCRMSGVPCWKAPTHPRGIEQVRKHKERT